jgi:hypothetical protein
VTTRTHFTFRIDTWTDESMVEQLAGVDDFQVALATYRAACERAQQTVTPVISTPETPCNRVAL